MKESFDLIRKDNRLLYEYITGSHLYGLNTIDSDIDTKGVFMGSLDSLLGFNSNYIGQVSDERNDNTWYELGKYMNLLCSSNPIVLESLFVPTDKIIGKIDPIMVNILENRDCFISKECFKPFMGYAINQIHKARGLNKKIMKPVHERLAPLDFAYTFYNQGSTKIHNWLEFRGLKQKYCGLVKIPNMHEVYGLYYDFGNHVLNEGITKDILFSELVSSNCNTMIHSKFLSYYYHCIKCNSMFDAITKLMDVPPIGYSGIVSENGKSNTIRLSSVSKGEIPLCHMSYNESGYKSHCDDYKSYKDWENNRNPVRYESNLNKNYDAKNMMHNFRLMSMACEVANGDGILLDRRVVGDFSFLLDVKNHIYEYDELIEKCDEKEKELTTAISKSTIRETVDIELVKDLLITSRKKYYNGMF